jgi:hypothetical protein
MAFTGKLPPFLVFYKAVDTFKPLSTKAEKDGSAIQLLCVSNLK